MGIPLGIRVVACHSGTTMVYHGYHHDLSTGKDVIQWHTSHESILTHFVVVNGLDLHR